MRGSPSGFAGLQDADLGGDIARGTEHDEREILGGSHAQEEAFVVFLPYAPVLTGRRA